MRRAKPDHRADAMAAMYANGVTLQAIGELYSISRERVRQILSRTHGMTRADGGKTISAQRNAQSRQARKDAACLAKYGCTHAEWREIISVNKGGKSKCPSFAFSRQKWSAKARGIQWNISLAEWWSIWAASGKWAERGRGHGYMMCRVGDTGAYEVGNVYIATGIHNGRVQPNNPYRKGHPEFRKSNTSPTVRTAGVKRVYHDLPTGVTYQRGRYIAQVSINGKNKYLGKFADPQAAHIAYVEAVRAAA